jgi:hypothetical protein
MPKGWLTAQQAAARLGVTPTRVRAIIAVHQQGKHGLPAEKFGSVWMIREHDLANYKPLPIGNHSSRSRRKIVKEQT